MKNPGNSTVNLITPQKKAEFLADFAVSGNVTFSAKKVGMNRLTIYQWINNDPNFASAFDNAKEEALDLLEKEIQRRGFEGNEREYYDKEGNVKSIVKEYSDTLAIFFLKGNRPEKYAERRQITGVDGKEVVFKVVYDENRQTPPKE